MDYYQLPELRKKRELFHVFSTKDAGDFGVGLNITDEIVKKRADWLRQFNINIADVITIQAVGGTDVFVLNQSNQKLPEEFDCVITNLKDIYFILTVADCLPIIVFNPKKEVLGLIHAGWRGLDGGIIGKTINKMDEAYGIPPQNLIAGIGPSIHKNSYIKDKSFREKISRELNKFVLDSSENKVKVDLISAAISQLEAYGVKNNNIEVSNQDTFSNNYFSHHRAKIKNEPEGRNLAVVGMRSSF